MTWQPTPTKLHLEEKLSHIKRSKIEISAAGGEQAEVHGMQSAEYMCSNGIPNMGILAQTYTPLVSCIVVHVLLVLCRAYLG